MEEGYHLSHRSLKSEKFMWQRLQVYLSDFRATPLDWRSYSLHQYVGRKPFPISKTLLQLLTVQIVAPTFSLWLQNILVRVFCSIFEDLARGWIISII